MIAWAIETFAATTLLMLLVLALRAPVRRHFGPHLAYALWLLPVLRLVMPPLPGHWQLSRLFAPVTRQATDAPGIVVGVMPPAALPPEAAHVAVQASVEIGSHHTSLALVPPTVVAEGASVALLLLGIWAIGALGFLGYHLIAHHRYCAALLRRARVDSTVAQGRVRVIETDAAHGPLAFGVFRKYVAFPRDFEERYDAQERDLALAHELGHHARGDLLANWAALIVLALHWFNPVAWRAFRAFRADQEIACDALVLAGRAQALRHAYGRAIVKSAHGGAVSAACHLHTINDVKGRLRMLATAHKNSPRRVVAGLASGALIGVSALGLTASGTQAAERLTETVTSVTDLSQAQNVPQPPAPPSAPAAPGMPQVLQPPAPPAPAAGESVTRVRSTQDGKRIEKIIVTRADGTQQVSVMPDMAPIILKMQGSIPQVRDGKCGNGGPEGETVLHREEGGKKIVIVCSDRIEAMSANAARMAMHGKRMGLEGARMGIESARRSIVNNGSLSTSAREGALRDLDSAMAEIEADLNEAD